MLIFTLFVLVLSLVVIGYVFGGYLLCLQILRVIKRESLIETKKLREVSEADLPEIAVLLTVHNEEAVLQDKLDDLLSGNYPSEKLKVIVASDMSTDGTNEVVRRYPDSRVSLFLPDSSSGKTSTQNQAINLISSDVVLFTDADTRFESDFIGEIGACFSDVRVGGVDGRLLFQTESGNEISQNQSRYWRYELALRQLESSLGLLCVGSGATLAVRRSLLESMPDDVGEDCVIPLLVVSKGYLMVHAHRAAAYDKMDTRVASEFRTRVRMTLRNWRGTLAFFDLVNPLRSPGYAYALWSHKLLRWLSPVFMIFATFGALGLAFYGSMIWPAALVVGFYLFASFGYYSYRQNLGFGLAETAFSFLLANAGFLMGTYRFLRKAKIHRYSDR